MQPFIRCTHHLHAIDALVEAGRYAPRPANGTEREPQRPRRQPLAVSRALDFETCDGVDFIR